MLDIKNKDWGSAKTLEGDIYVLCFYVGTPFAPVTPEVHQTMGADLAEAEYWLQQQAALYGKRLRFKNAAYGMNGEITLKEVPVDAKSPNAFYFPEEVYKAQHFKNGWDVSEYIRKHLTESRQWISIILCNSKGRSFACPVNKRLVTYDEKMFFLESCVVFRYNSWYPYSATKSASYAHEILHLFGAADLYAHDDSEKEEMEQYRRR